MRVAFLLVIIPISLRKRFLFKLVDEVQDRTDVEKLFHNLRALENVVLPKSFCDIIK